MQPSYYYGGSLFMTRLHLRKTPTIVWCGFLYYDPATVEVWLFLSSGLVGDSAECHDMLVLIPMAIHLCACS